MVPDAPNENDSDGEAGAVCPAHLPAAAAEPDPAEVRPRLRADVSAGTVTGYDAHHAGAYADLPGRPIIGVCLHFAIEIIRYSFNNHVDFYVRISVVAIYDNRVGATGTLSLCLPA